MHHPPTAPNGKGKHAVTSNDGTKIIPITQYDAPPLTDAQLVATWAAQALSEGRYALGEALAQLARRADRKSTELNARAAQRDMFGTPNRGPAPDLPSDAPQLNAHCAFVLEEHGSRRMCSLPLFWHDGGGDVLPGWYHRDAEITDHVPILG